MITMLRTCLYCFQVFKALQVIFVLFVFYFLWDYSPSPKGADNKEHRYKNIVKLLKTHQTKE